MFVLLYVHVANKRRLSPSTCLGYSVPSLQLTVHSALQIILFCWSLIGPGVGISSTQSEQNESFFYGNCCKLSVPSCYWGMMNCLFALAWLVPPAAFLNHCLLFILFIGPVWCVKIIVGHESGWLISSDCHQLDAKINTQTHVPVPWRWIL